MRLRGEDYGRKRMPGRQAPTGGQPPRPDAASRPPNTMKPGRKPLTEQQMLDWLQTHVYLDGDCRLWAGSVHAQGMPVVSWNRKTHLARRLLLQLRGLPVGARTWMTCGNERCMALRHMRTGTAAEMLADLGAMGRLHGGPKHALAVSLGRAQTARMGIDKAGEVFAALGRGETSAEIGARYGVTAGAVRVAVRKWRRAGVNELNVRIAA